MEDSKNVLWAMVLSLGLLAIYYQFFAAPMVEEQQRQAAIEEEIAGEADIVQPMATPAQTEMSVESVRIPIRTPSIEGSFQLTGSRFDDITLLTYDATVEEGSPKVSLLVPDAAGSDYAAYVFDNWTPREGGSGALSQWELVSGSELTPTTPVAIRHSGQGFTVDRTVSIDDKFLITLDDRVTNSSGAPLDLVRRGASRQHGTPEGLTNFFILQEGPIAVVGGDLLKRKYKKLTKQRRVVESGESGWVGLTDKYWFAGAIPPQERMMEARFNYSLVDDRDLFEAAYVLDPVTISAGSTIESRSHVYVGAKERDVLETYEADLGIDKLDLAIDWGALSILVRPMSTALSWLGEKIGNYGLAIMALTLIIKIILFPLFNKQHVSMAKMKKLSPELARLKEVYGDDRMKLQQEMMALYKKEGANPVAGCLPIIPTIFVFFALYKTVFINVDLRHAPFFGWIRDLSAKDPLSVLNLFGALPWDANPIGIGFLAIGPLALMYGVSMWLTQTTQATGAGGDPMQKKIIALLPWVFMFVLAPFAAGLLVYWVWNNILTFLQSYVITRKYGVETTLDIWFKKLTGRGTPDGVEILEPEK